MNVVEPGRGDPEVGGRHRSRHVLDRDPAVERHPLGDPERRRPAREAMARCRRGRTARDGCPDRGGRPRAGRWRRQRDVELVGRGQRAGVDDPERAVGPERPARPSQRGRTGSRLGEFGTIVSLSARTPSPSSRSAISSFTGHTRSANAIDSRSWRRSARWTSGLCDVREAGPEELGHRLVEVEDDLHPAELERERGEHEEVRQAVDLDHAVVTASMGAGRRPARPDEEAEVLA